jgi:hypothetical protein
MGAVAIRRLVLEYSLLMLFVVLQVGFWYRTHEIEPDMGIVPEVPSRDTLKALTFGDDQFYFRVMGFTLQNAGDTFGRFTSLRYYDFDKLYQWFTLMDLLDAKSNMMPSMATYYFSQTQNTPDIRYIADYLYEHGSRDVEHKWWWLMQAVYLALHKLDDKDLALKAAKPLQDGHVPVWARQMTAVVYEKRGEMDDALQIMESIRANVDNIPEADLNYMTYFVKERLGKLEKSKEFGVWPPPKPARMVPKDPHP